MPASEAVAGRIGKAEGQTPMMDDRGKSDRPVVPTNPPNKASAAEAEEGRGLAKGNVGQQNVPRTQSRTGTPSALDCVRRAARQRRDEKFTALFHHLTIDLLRMSFYALKRTAAPGVDGVTWEQYGQDLESNLQNLHGRLHRGVYRAKPSRRAFIPKADGKQRPLGIASLEDKVVQRAVVTVLNGIYEVDFLGFSYGFRPGRNQHRALDALAVGILRRKVNWVLDADIRGFFDNLSKEWLLRFLEHRVGDRRILRLIQKWLNAGVLHDGVKTVADTGSPQGATISPLLANVYLHYAFDLWVEWWRRRNVRGDVIVVRYADDIVLGFQYETDASQFRTALGLRLAKFGLELHPDKTRLLRFGRYAARERRVRGEGKPEAFDFLGFTHICGRSRAGHFLLLRHTVSQRMRSVLKTIRLELKTRRHLPVPVQGLWLQQKLRGYFAYHAIPTNIPRLSAFRTQVVRSWLFALRRRSQRTRMTWERMKRLESRWIPSPHVLHPWPEQRFDAMTQGKSPVR